MSKVKVKIDKNSLILLFIILLGAFIRLRQLNTIPSALFSDEVDIAYQVKSLLETNKDYSGYPFPWQFHSFSDIRTSIPIYLTALVSLIPQVSLEQAVRLVPALFGIIGILATYLFANQLFSKKAPLIGLISALLIALSPWHFHYSRAGFEVSLLYAFFVFGLYLFQLYLTKAKQLYLWTSLIILALIPMIYSTAKLSLIFLPLLLLLLPQSNLKLLKKRKIQLFLLLLFLPLSILIFSGGTTKRFKEISIFTDPTLASQVNYNRQVALGLNPSLGSSPSFFSRLAHNKPLYLANNIAGNLLQSLSTDFLFVKGDSNPRHSVPTWGVLIKTQAILIFIGLFYLFSRWQQSKKIFLFLLTLIILSIAPASITRNGGTHATRLFLLLLPLTLISSLAFYQLLKAKKIIAILVGIIFIYESFLYLQNYFAKYPFESERRWHAGLKQVIQASTNHPNKTIIISDKYEPPLIFYLYYSGFPPERLQTIIKNNSLFQPLGPETNLKGYRFSNTNILFASLQKKKDLSAFTMPNSVYYLTREEISRTPLIKEITINTTIKLPSGEDLFYEIINK